MKITDQVIAKLFWILRNEYGSRWVMLHNEPGSLDNAKAEWKKGLSRYKAGDITKVLKVIKQLYPKTPPTMDEFKAMLSESKKHRPGHLSNHLWTAPACGERAKKSTQEACMREIMGAIST